jgi:hypothetical protein
MWSNPNPKTLFLIKVEAREILLSLLPLCLTWEHCQHLSIKLTIVLHPLQKGIINFQNDTIPTQNLYEFKKKCLISIS